MMSSELNVEAFEARPGIGAVVPPNRLQPLAPGAAPSDRYRFPNDWMLGLDPVTASGLLTPPLAFRLPPMTLRRSTIWTSEWEEKLIGKTP